MSATMSAVIHVAKSDITLAKVAKFYVRNEHSMLSIPSGVPVKSHCPQMRQTVSTKAG